ncbi:MAG: BsuBI/PstI family type II restriction endonuclease, partial [Pyrinomonadaceae bacterium]
MSKVEEAKEVLKSLGLPAPQQNEMSALTLLALCGLGPDDDWKRSRRHSLTVTKGIMAFIEEAYGKRYAPNTRETFRRQVLHQFVQARIADYNPDAPDLPTNSPRAHYALSEAALAVVR